MTYFGARNLHRKLLDSPYFASKFLQRFVLRMTDTLGLKNSRYSLTISSTAPPQQLLIFLSLQSAGG